MAAHRSEEPTRRRERQAAALSGGENGERSVVADRALLEKTHDELTEMGTTIAMWLRARDISNAEALYVLCGITLLLIEDAWPDVHDRPKQFQILLEAIDSAGQLIGGLTLLARAKVEDLHGDQ